MHKRLKIVHVTPDLHLGGGGVKTLLKTFFYCFDSKLMEKIIVTNQSDESDRKDFHALGVSVFSRLITSQLDQGNALEITQWLIETLKQLKPDIVHTHLFWGDTLGRQAAFRAGIPVIVSTEHNTNLDESEKHRKIKRRLAQMTDCVVCVSEAVRKYSREIDQIPDDRMTVIYNSILLKDYEFNSDLKNRKQSEFVYVGRLEPQKNPLLLIEAFAEIAFERPDCRLCIIGNGSLMEQCLDKVQVLGLSTQVKFFGYQQKPWIAATQGSIFVLSSDFEGLPMAILEAMASGHVCILPKTGTIPEIADAGSEAIFYEAGNRDSLIDAMRFVLDMPEEQRIEIVQSARARVEKDFDAYKMTEQYLNLYQKLYLIKSKQMSSRENFLLA
jgi:glycosyltransferase involved in cell wall biosynthesis